MAFTLLALLDDISTVLDDVAVLTKAAARKTAGVLGDDLALTAQQVFGVRAHRELPVIFSVAKGSAVNKLILIPAALLISWLAPWLITPILMIGGLYLCAEGGEKTAHFLFRRPVRHTEEELAAIAAAEEAAASGSRREMELLEKKKIAGAIRTDFVLSAEITVIALGSIPLDSSLAVRAAILVLIGLLVTAGVYGLAGLIVKLDDIGFWLTKKFAAGRFLNRLGRILLRSAPMLMKFLTFTGTAAMFLVGGGILIHGLPFVQKWLEYLPLWPPLENLLAGFLAGAAAYPLAALAEKHGPWNRNKA
ncbi:MAG: DUF808 domain-containing protein [Deltaproteobacteria bacterium]|jgi:predicted DNA repair protein MutK|nr:DUF808 domain-containing protein [Deltaproteobacteria bacterium]